MSERARPPLAGVMGPVVTAFGAQGALARGPFEENVRAHLAAGLSGLVVAGSTGEAVLLDDAERRSLVEWARMVVPDHRWLIAGAGAESTRGCIRLARDAAAAGADAVLVAPPHYYAAAMTDLALAGHYCRVADASPVPVLLYNIPKYTHLPLASALVCSLAAHERIIGIKDSAGDAALLAGYLSAQNDGFAVLTGHAGRFHDALRAGARGGILAAALFAAPVALGILAAAAAGEDERAADGQRRLAPLAAEIVAGLGVAGVKAALDAIGLSGGPLRSPLRPLDTAERMHVRTLIEAAGLAAH